MILPQSYVQSLVLAILSLLLLGSWPMLLKHTKGRRFELFGLDFAIGVFLTALLWSLTFGNLGSDSFDFVDDVMHAGKSQWVIGFGAGAIFGLGTMLLLGAVAVAGVSVAVTVSGGLSLILGIGLPQLLRKTLNPLFLFAAFTLILVAIVCAALVHGADIAVRVQALVSQARTSNRKLMGLPSAVKGILLAAASGLLYSLYYPLAVRSREGEIGLGPYSGIFLLAVGIFISAPVLFVFFINLPVEGEPLEFSSYFKTSLTSHFIGLLAGFMWTTGTLITVVSAAAEPGAQIPRQISLPLLFAVPLLSALWGIATLREGRTPSGGIRPAALLMVVLLAASVALLAFAPAIQTGT
jgi:glucose uptake protein